MQTRTETFTSEDQQTGEKEFVLYSSRKDQLRNLQANFGYPDLGISDKGTYFKPEHSFGLAS